ncbi:MAG TPA: MotA/TolQ/ExbB proton channel family protein [Bdellovibrionota bacterium]|jgi:biopolymer transport protein ExbB/TolQ|nr:MotA/TolQ/ExbB proton channel family protein [Bdellovibrionota bacterium]
MESPSFIQELIRAFQDGGPWMVAIALALAFSITLCLERFVRLYFQYNVDGPSFMFEIQKYILANDLDGAIRICNGAGNAALPRVVKAGLQRASRTDDQIQNAIDAVSLEMIPKLERRLPYLSMIANVATLLGLLGTITGLIRSFNALAEADPAQRQAILSAGIAMAMNATAFGLITAIFTMVSYTVLTAKANRILEEIDEFGVKLLDLLAARKYRHSAEKGGRD